MQPNITPLSPQDKKETRNITEFTEPASLSPTSIPYTSRLTKAKATFYILSKDSLKDKRKRKKKKKVCGEAKLTSSHTPHGMELKIDKEKQWLGNICPELM